ncbi:alpha/beta hydrolase [Pseudonocardia endophytica]|uniref:Acetyl esterase/lipase n=1 Tax=Pseudonocardia endophytica TaxID=401976 RepID=A0A4R1HLI7_PSEEN|nr:alpha/beta hydrolase [Pseudonocardia endophytica]TCK21365.1 acetyl esterase/lipase [Pseudonocardia endophytica]
MTTAPVRPPYDPELAALLPAVNEVLPSSIRPDDLKRVREQVSAAFLPIDEVIAGRAIEYEDRTIPGPEGAPDVVVTILRPAKKRIENAPGVYHTHGGGMILGDRFTGVDQLCDWVLEFGVVAVTVEYRLAPEHPDPAPIEDCYAGLVWTAANAAELGIDPARLVLAGGSAGGGLAAGLALMARDRGGPSISAQMLIYPMLDDRNETPSADQFEGIGIWDRISNDTAWTMLLGDRRRTGDVSPYAAPARAAELAGLPPAFVDVCSTETFRDEDIAYASRLCSAGVQTELHVWPGGFHGFDSLAPDAPLSRQARAARVDWLRRIARF